ncbi:MAG TPA: AAA family ATPase [Lentisphaeria bacterium]|nr:MAG: hypothetical protein A2X47_05995 [Lentisphaerae bacterium GWF2_38_69]HBM14776.1 AAA family ATPase [Lentisphaeria bacterium]
MNAQEIENLIKQGEGLRIEFKEARDTVPASFYETVVSFSNTDGGTILLGVTDEGQVVGIDPKCSIKLQKDIITALNSRDCINPPLYIQPFIVRLSEGEVMVIQIPASSQIHDHAGRIYIREFEVDIDVTGNQHKISDLYLRKRNFFTEAQIIPHLAMEDLDVRLFDKARQIIRNFRSDHPWLLVSNEQMLKDSVLWRKDFMTAQEGLTLASALIFGKDTTIQSILPAYKVEAMVRIHNTDRWDDRINPPLRTNLIDTYLALKKFINEHLPEKFYMERDQRVDLRDKIFREVIGNAIVHREYTSALSTELIITASEVIMTNPNRPLFHGPIDLHKFNPYPKNPNIRKFFTAFGWTDEIGSGIRNTSRYLPLYSSGAAPVFLEEDTFKTVLPLIHLTMGDYAKEFHSWLELPTESLDRFERGLKSIALPSSMAKAKWEDLILYLVPSYHQKGTQLQSLKWPKNQLHTKESIEKVPSYHQKGTELLSKKVRYILTILALSIEPIKMSELMSILDYKNNKTFRDNYILPLRQEGLIELTNPENPTDPENKYSITEKGKIFLGGME